MTDKYTKSAKGQKCQVRLPGICNHNPETVIFAHLNGAGLAMKAMPIHGSYCCSNCHDVVDGRDYKALQDIGMHRLKLYLLEGVIRTQEIMVKEGVLCL